MVKTLTGQSASLFNTNIYFWFQPEKLDRLKIREQIVKQFASKLSTEEKQNILNINNLPKSSELYFSISHSPAGSGYVAARFPLGLDIEQVQRTQHNKLIERVSTSFERELLKDKWFLIWSAKEAGFKYQFQNDQNIKTMSEIKINEIKSQEFNECLLKLSFNDSSFSCHCMWTEDNIVCTSY